MKLKALAAAVLFLIAISGATARAAETETSNPCLRIPEIPYGQRATTEYQPESCITSADTDTSNRLASAVEDESEEDFFSSEENDSGNS